MSSVQTEGFSSGGRAAVSIIGAGVGVVAATVMALSAMGLLGKAEAATAHASLEMKVDRIEGRQQEMAKEQQELTKVQQRMAEDVAVLKDRILERRR